MSTVCSCPAAAALTSIPGFTCGESFGQIQKLAFQRLSYVDDGDVIFNGFVEGTNSIKEKASWTELMAATDGSKIVVTPYVENPTQEGGDAITFGGGNETLGGVEEYVGRNASQISFVLRKYPQSTIKALKELQCETNLGVYLISEHGSFEAIEGTDGATPTPHTKYTPIPIRSVFVGDKVHGGLEEPDTNSLSFNFLPNYSDDLKIVAPEEGFNPLIELVVA